MSSAWIDFLLKASHAERDLMIIANRIQHALNRVPEMKDVHFTLFLWRFTQDLVSLSTYVAVGMK